MVWLKILVTAATVAGLILMWEIIASKRIYMRGKMIGWFLAGIFTMIGLWLVLDLWGLLQFLTSTAVVGVWFFFFMWFTKDLFLDNFFAGIKLTARGRLKPGDRISIRGEECTVEEIRAMDTVLRTSKGLMVVPNVRIAQEAIIYRTPEEIEKKKEVSKEVLEKTARGEKSSGEEIVFTTPGE